MNSAGISRDKSDTLATSQGTKKRSESEMATSFVILVMREIALEDSRERDFLCVMESSSTCLLHHENKLRRNQLCDDERKKDFGFIAQSVIS